MMYPAHSTTPSIPRRFAAALALSVPLSGALAPAADFPIGVSFTETPAHQLAATESAGAPGFAQTNWNNRGRWGNPSALNDATGTATAVTVKWDATGIWANNANETLGGSSKLMKGYLDSNGQAISGTFGGVFGGDNDKPTILVTGVGAWMAANHLTSFSVVIYADGDSGAGDRATRTWLAATDPNSSSGGDPGLGPDLTSRIDIIDSSNWGDNPNFVRVNGTSGVGNYTVFSGLTADSFYIRLDEAGSNPWRCPINGFQIVGTDVVEAPDADNDGLPDFWENNHGLDPLDNGSTDIDNGPAGDPDDDNRTNLEEYHEGIDSTNPRKKDTDDDGLDDGEEFTAGTLPLDPDSDNDLLPDGWEVANQLDPLDDGSTDEVNGPSGDPDADELVNALEFERGADPRDKDTDDDGYWDNVEDLFGSWNGEQFTGTSPVKADSDGDGIKDGDENPEFEYAAGTTYGTDPNKADSDGDGTNDRWEFLLGTDPTLDTSNLPVIPVANGSFELPDAAGGFLTGTPNGWTFVNSTAADDIFVESISGVGLSGGAGAQYAGIQEPGGYLKQDTGIAFAPNTTYLIDLAGGLRQGFGSGILEFGLMTGDLPSGLPGRFNSNVLATPGAPDNDGGVNKFRDASQVAAIGSGSLGRPCALVTGATPPSGNVVVYIRHVSGFRVIFDNLRILAVPNSVDADDDDLPDAWELVNGLSTADNGSTNVDNGPAGDPDEDGFTNAEELAANSDPNSSTSVPVVPDPKVSAHGITGSAFQLSVENLVPAKSYTLARSATLEGFTAIGTPVTGVTTHTFSDDPVPEGKAFYRVQEVGP